jgi:putative spermidine/putrescine transport system ATP-binding protein
MFHLEVNQLHKSYGDTKVFEGLNSASARGLVTCSALRLWQVHLLRALAGLTGGWRSGAGGR